MSDYTYDATVVRIHDGDTVFLDVDLGLEQWWRSFCVRLFGINAPELNTPAGKESAVYLAGLLPVGSAVTLQTIKDQPDKFGGRYLGVITPAGSTLAVNDAMVQAGHAVHWDGKGPKPV